MDFSKDEFDEILKIFLAESDEIISRLNNNLLILEKSPENNDVILEIFRDAHSLKGAARMIGFTNIQNVAHKMEDVLGLAKDKEIALNSKVINVLYKTIDFLSDLIKKTVINKAEPADIDINSQISIIDSAINSEAHGEEKEKVSNQKIDLETLTEKISQINGYISNCLFILMRLEIKSEPNLILELLQSVDKLCELFNVSGLMSLKRGFSNIKLKLDFVNHGAQSLNHSEISELEVKFNEIIDGLVSVCEINNIEVIDYYSQALDAMTDFNNSNNIVAEDDNKELENSDDNNSKFLSEEALNVSIDEDISAKELNLSGIKNQLATLNKNNSHIVEIIDFLRVFRQKCTIFSVNQILEKIDLILSYAQKEGELLSEDDVDVVNLGIDYCEGILNEEDEAIDNTLILQRLEIINQIQELKQGKSSGFMESYSESMSNIAGERADFSKILNSGEIKTLRVDSTKLDSLVNQVGELIVAKMKNKKHVILLNELSSDLEEWQRNSSRLFNHIEYYEKKYLNKLTQKDNNVAILMKQLIALQSENLQKISSVFNNVLELKRSVQDDNMKTGNIVDDLEQMVKDVRVLPISTIFNMFGRMVRDIANEKNKKIELEIIGSEVCTDKKIIEEIKTPLIHIIRNSIDHGIETPEERISLGKPPVGKIILRAKQEDNKIIIEVEDDGRGINLAKVREKALHNGLLTHEEVEGMTDEQIMNIIFLPGFSTGETVTDISGRGIGLDVVQNKIGQLNGKINVISEFNCGCCLRLELPTAMSTVKVFLTKVASQSFALPIATVEGVVLRQKEEIFTNKNGKSIKYNNMTIPVFSLSDILKINSNEVKSNKSTILIFNYEGFVGIQVDKLIGEQDVLLKKLVPPFYKIKNISGVTTLETGEICIVLNLNELLKIALNRHALPSTPENKKLPILKKMPKDYNILLIDDSITTRTLEKNILEKLGYIVEQVSNPIEAEQVINRKRFDLFVCDVEMPEMNGIEFLKRLKTDEMFYDIPFIFVSSNMKKENIDNAKKLGAFAYLSKKDFNQENFVKVVGKSVEKNQD